MNCPRCESVMLVEVFGTLNPIRCASCGNVSSPPNKKATDVHRYAWRSLWLGFASILLLFLTGLPAIWYGVHSLLRMRFVRSQSKDRIAAVAGVALGVIFGIVGTATVGFFGGFIALFMMSMEETKDADRIDEILTTIGSIEVPADFQAIEANRFANQFSHVNWRDGSKAKEAMALMRLVAATPGTTLGGPHISSSTNQFRLYRDMAVDPDSRKIETLSWTVANEVQTVTKTTEAATDGDFNSVCYEMKTESDNEQQVYVLLVCIREPGKYSEEDVKKIFESFKPKK